MRRMLFASCVTIISLGLAWPAQAQKQITLSAKDGLTITADVYQAANAKATTWIVLAHQAQASRGEYRTIAPRLNALGYHAIALDQRSGGSFGGVTNRTAVIAKNKGKKTGYLSATPDILAGIAWARAQGRGPVILWGSSYSAALALLLAGEQPKLVDGAVANAPGEYLRGKSIRKVAPNIKVPVLITSPATERRRWSKIFAAIKDKRKTGYAPRTGGRHGSSAFIAARNKSADAYWKVATEFLQKHFR